MDSPISWKVPSTCNWQGPVEPCWTIMHLAMWPCATPKTGSLFPSKTGARRMKFESVGKDAYPYKINQLINHWITSNHDPIDQWTIHQPSPASVFVCFRAVFDLTVSLDLIKRCGASRPLPMARASQLWSMSFAHQVVTHQLNIKQLSLSSQMIYCEF